MMIFTLTSRMTIMAKFKEFLSEAPDSAIQRLRDQIHALSDQMEDIIDAGGQVTPTMQNKMKQLRNQLKMKKRQLGASSNE